MRTPSPRSINRRMGHSKFKSTRFETKLFDDPGRLGHDRRIAAADLPRPRRFFRRGEEQPQGAAIAAGHVGGVGAFAAHQSGAEAFGQQPETPVAMLLQGSLGNGR